MKNQREEKELLKKNTFKRNVNRNTSRKKVSKSSIIDKENFDDELIGTNFDSRKIKRSRRKNVKEQSSNTDSSITDLKENIKNDMNSSSYSEVRGDINNSLDKAKENIEENIKDKNLREKTLEFFRKLEKKFSSMFEEEKKVDYISEYYDLPYKYNDDSVRVIAQSPKKLFVYWDIDDNKRKDLEKEYGEDFFDKTHPILVVTNKNTKNVFEVQIDDFTNTWYIDIPDSPSNYQVSYARKAYTDFAKQQDSNSGALYVESLDGVSSSFVKANDIIVLAHSNETITPSGSPMEFGSNISFVNVNDNSTFTVDTKDLINNSNLLHNKLDEYIEENYEDNLSSSSLSSR